jgi:hypothetical protein
MLFEQPSSELVQEAMDDDERLQLSSAEPKSRKIVATVGSVIPI